MKLGTWITILGLLAGGLGGVSPKERFPGFWEFPALTMGTDRWSILKIANRADSPRSVVLEVFDPKGLLTLDSGRITLAAGQLKEIRLDGKSGRGWARLREEKIGRFAVEVDAVVEILRGNQIETFAREAVEPVETGIQLVDRSDLDSKVLYVLNTSDESALATFCTIDRRAERCSEVTGASRHPILARRAVELEMGDRTHRYLRIECSPKRKLSLITLSAEPGARREFSTESSILFGDAEK